MVEQIYIECLSIKNKLDEWLIKSIKCIFITI